MGEAERDRTGKCSVGVEQDGLARTGKEPMGFAWLVLQVVAWVMSIAFMLMQFVFGHLKNYPASWWMFKFGLTSLAVATAAGMIRAAFY